MKCAIMYKDSIFIIEHENEELLNKLADTWEKTVLDMFNLNFTTYVALYRDRLGIPLDATLTQERAAVSLKYGKTPIVNKEFAAAMKESIEQFNESKISYPEPVDWFLSRGCAVWKVDRVVKVISE